MYRLPVIMMIVGLVAGCGHFKNSDFLSGTGESQSNTSEGTAAADYDQDVQLLFDQPYIDPLTEYLQRHEEDSAREAELKQVREERERRCAAVARRYNTDEITETGLALYRRGYSFSCPQDVAAYETKLEAMQQTPVPDSQPVNESLGDDREASDDELAESGRKAEKTETQTADNNQTVSISPQLNDCYLLTRIRNFSDALKACRGPADDGVAGAQASMAQIENVLGNQESAYRWARQAAPDSGPAAYLLGKLYAKGLGVTKDRNAAAKWFRIAMELGHPEAETALDNLTSATAGANVD